MKYNIRYSAQPGLFSDGRMIAWFSCGAASACMLKLLAPHKPMAVYCDTSRNEHKDNARFLKDVEAWTGQKITVISSRKYETIEQVFDERKYMSGPKGAPCTVELKKVPRFEMQRPNDVHCFGMGIDEKRRIEDFQANNWELNLCWPLLDEEMTKADCLAMLEFAGIELPVLYRQGFKNNNCIGCVKAQSPKYWNKVRRLYPETFANRAEQSRRIGCKLTRIKGEHIFLDQLQPDDETDYNEDLSCGPQCTISNNLQEI